MIEPLIDIKQCPKNEYVEMYDSNDTLICETNNDIEFLWVRGQIKRKHLKGCYIKFHDKKILIDEKGNPTDYPDGMFSLIGHMCIVLL